MLFVFGATPGIPPHGDKLLITPQQVNQWINLLSLVVYPALATLVPAGVFAVFKWAQEHSSGKRRVQLTERVSVLTKAIAELPPEAASPVAGTMPALELPAVSADKSAVALKIAVPTPRTALNAELEAVLRELTVLQTRVTARRFTPGFSTATLVSKLRAALLLYKPKGTVAWLLHIFFYSYLVILAFFIVAIMSPTSDTPTTTAGNAPTALVAGAGSTAGNADAAAVAPKDTFAGVVAFIFLFGIAGIPPMVIRYFAAKIHRKQMGLLPVNAAGGLGTTAQETVTAST